METEQIEAVPSSEEQEPVVAADPFSEDETDDVSAAENWPPEPPALAHLEQEAANESTTDDDDDDDGDSTPEAGEPPAPTEEPRQEPTEDQPRDPKSERAERRRQRILDEYRASPEYQEELARAREAERAAEALERQQEAERVQREQAAAEANRRYHESIGEFLGTQAGADGKPVYDRLSEQLTADEARIAELAATIAEADDPYDVEDERTELATVTKRRDEAKAQKALLDGNRRMSQRLNDLAWSGIATDYESILAFPELASLSDEQKAAIGRPTSLKDGLARLREAIVAGATAAHRAEIESLKAAHATEIKALNADREALRARAGGAGGSAETRGTAAGGGGLTLERYQRLSPEQQADIPPAEIDRMMAEALAQRRAQAA